MTHKATLKNRPGDGMGTLKIEVVRQSDNQSLGTIRYNPDSPASCEDMEEELAAIAGRYSLEYVQE
jgi:hypothetical protein